MTVKTEKTKFNPKDWMTDIHGKDYLPVAARLIWFREEHPEWGIQTEIIKEDETHAIMKATICNGNQTIAQAHKKEDKIGFGDFLEKAETGAIGRALAMCGFGTQFSPDIEEGTQRIVDAPIEKKTPVEVTQPQTPAIKSAGEVQRKMYFAVAKSAGYESEKAKEMAKKQFKLESFNNITSEQISKMIGAFSKKVVEKPVNTISDEDIELLSRELE